MSLYTFASTHGSPGVTSAVMGLAAVWRATTGRDVLVVEADPDGGVLAARFDGLRADRTLADVAVDVRRSFDIDIVLRSAQHAWDTVPVIVAPPSAEQTQSALTTAGERLAAGLAGAEQVDVLADLGRLTSRSPALALARRAVTTVLVVRPSFDAVASLASRVPELRSRGCTPSLVTIGETPYSPHDVEQVAESPLLAALPDDPRSATVFSGTGGSPRRLQRSLLWRTITDLATRLDALVPTPVEHVPAGKAAVDLTALSPEAVEA